MVPHLTTALTGPLMQLEKKILDAMPAIERWLRLAWQKHQPPFYSSVDLRNAGFKLAPIDTNLFPGGFNNLAPDTLPLAVQATVAVIEKLCPDAKNVLLIPERHTRNLFYLQNVACLSAILRQAGLNVRLGSLSEEITTPTPIALSDGQQLLLEPLVRLGNQQQRLGLADFDPCVILLNNDLSSGIPTILKNLTEQTVLPPLHAGWSTRRKSAHFAAYNQVAQDFAQFIDIDPWMINPLFTHCSNINFQDRLGEQELQARVDMILKQIAQKYREHDIHETPYVVVKADAGTYGMGIMTVKDPAELLNLNRKERNKMSVIKEGLTVNDVIIQEGVHSFEKINDSVAEPVIYMIDRYVVSGFYRVHTERGVDENLNAPGMHFVPLAFDDKVLPNPDAGPGVIAPNRFYMYGVIGRLAALAAAIELENTAPARSLS